MQLARAVSMRHAEHHRERDRRLDQREPDEIGEDRRALGAGDRLAERIAVDQPGKGEQREREVAAQRLLAEQNEPERDHRQRDEDLGVGTVASPICAAAPIIVATT